MSSRLRIRPLPLLTLGLLLILLAPALLPAVSPAGAAPQAATWTFMVYLAADNNLEPYAIDDFIEMAAAGSDAHLNIVVQFDRIPDYDSRYDNWTSTKRFLVTPGMVPDANSAVQDIDEADMGDPQTAIDFINWARTNYPADHYVLVWWNHGGGWLDSFVPQDIGPNDFCWDDTNGSDALTSAELYQILGAVTNGGAAPLDLVAFDACLMAMWEVDNQIKPFGSAVSVSSEETEPGAGWPYNTILSDLKANPGWGPAQLGDDIVWRYYQSYGNGETQSAKDLAGPYTTLNQAVDDLAVAMIAHEETYHDLYDAARSDAQSFQVADFIDLYDLATQIDLKISDPDLNAAAMAVMGAVDAAVIREEHGVSWPGAHGISFYFPTYLPGDWTAYRSLRSSQLTHWDEFVEYHITGQLPCAQAQIERVAYAVDAPTVAFTPTVSGDPPIAYQWDFGDGATSTETNPIHTFPGPGTYTVTLEVGNCSGLGHDSWTKVLRVIPGCHYPVDIVAVSYTVDDRRVAFTTMVEGEGPIGYHWTFGDGQGSEETDPVHLYRTYGLYTATLVVSNCAGLASDTWQEAIPVLRTPCVLLVDDDQNKPDVRGSYTSTLEALGLTYEVWDTAGHGSPSSNALHGHPIVLWFTGYPWQDTLNPGDEAAVAAYLNAGGHFFLSGEDYLYDRELTPFGQDYLGISSYTDDVKAVDPVGRGGDPIGDGLGPYLLTPPAGWPGTTLWTDAVSGVQASPFRWQGSGQDNSTAYDGDSFKTVFFGWPLEGLANLEDRKAVLGRVVDWFGGCGPWPAIRAEPAGLEATLDIGGHLTQTLWLINTLEEPLTFTLQEAPLPLKVTGIGLPWLSETPISGTLSPGEPLPVIATFDAAQLTPGLYPGLLDLQSDDPDFPHRSIPVTLTVLPPCDPVTAVTLTWEPSTPLVVQPVTWTASAGGSTPITFTWAFGDGAAASGEVATHTYLASGPFTATLTATNRCGSQAVRRALTVLPRVIYLPLVVRGYRP